MVQTHARVFLAAAILLLPAFAPGGAAQQSAAIERFVTGSANTDGFTIAGRLRLTTAGKASGQFTIIVHRDSLGGETVTAVICEYNNFDGVFFNGDLASFHSVGKCKALTSTGGQQAFTSDNAFGIADHGDPGAGTDTVDVNLLSGTGVTIPGSLLVDGNFIVSP